MRSSIDRQILPLDEIDQDCHPSGQTEVHTHPDLPHRYYNRLSRQYTYRNVVLFRLDMFIVLPKRADTVLDTARNAVCVVIYVSGVIEISRLAATQRSFVAAKLKTYPTNDRWILRRSVTKCFGSRETLRATSVHHNDTLKYPSTLIARTGPQLCTT